MPVEERTVDSMHTAILIPRPVSARLDSLVTHSCSVCPLLDPLFAHLAVEKTVTVNITHQTDVLVTKALLEILTLDAKAWNNKPVKVYSVDQMLLAQCPQEHLSVFVAKDTLEIPTVDVMILMSAQQMSVV
jgi:hypothetical protein